MSRLRTEKLHVRFAGDTGAHDPAIQVHFRAAQRRYRRMERWGKPADYWQEVWGEKAV